MASNSGQQQNSSATLPQWQQLNSSTTLQWWLQLLKQGQKTVEQEQKMVEQEQKMVEQQLEQHRTKQWQQPWDLWEWRRKQQLNGEMEHLQYQQQHLQYKQQRINNKIAFAYTLAVKEGKCAANQFKLVMLGAEGSGKTSTTHSLLDKDFIPQQPSTMGADVSNTCTVDRYCVTDWKLKEFYEHLKDIPIYYKHELQEAMVEPTNSQMIIYQEDLEDMGMTVPQIPQDLLQNEEAVPDGKIRIVVYDLGGQEVFYEIHFLFLASFDIVFLTFNASINLDAPVARRQRYTISLKVYKTRKTQTNYQVIEATLNAIYCHCGMVGNEDSLSPRIPTVVLVGTHAFNLTVEEKKLITKTLIERLADKPLFDHFPRNKADAIHFIDNKERDTEAFSHLKAVALRAAYSATTEERPVSYLKFEEKILKISQKEIEIEVERACGIASSAGLEKTPGSMLALLRYYNSKGILLYYPEVEELKNLIFISPQNVSDLVSCVIKTHDYAEPIPSAALRKKFDRFDEFGILEESLLDDILKRSGYAKNIVLAFLKKFDLAVEIDKDTKFQNEDDSYRTPDTGRVFFIPSMLVYNEGEKYIKPEGHTDNAALFYFPDKFLPDTLFNHVLISTIKWCQNNGHHICRVHRGIGAFDFNGGKQGFALEQCSATFSIKCCIYVLQQEVCDRDLWQQRWDLIQEHLQFFILDAHKRCISKAQQPITYMECPVQHDENCAPHIRLDALAIDRDVWCTKVNPKRLISKDAYNLLLKPNDQPTTGSVRKLVLVDGAVVFSQLQNKDDVPSMRDLNRYVVYKYASEWEDIAIELGLDKQVEIIKKDNRECIDCLRRTLQKWLDSTPSATWKTLEIAITNAKRAQLSLDPVTDVYVSEERGVK